MDLPIRVSLEFLNLSADAKVSFGNGVTDGLSTHSATFPALPIGVPDLKLINQALSTALGDATTGSKLAKATLKNAIANWNEAFRSTAEYVNDVADENEEIIAEANFDSTKSERQKWPIPAQCANFEVSVDKGCGCFSATCDGEDINKGYVCIAAPAAVGISQNGNTLAITVNGVTAYINLGTRSKFQFKDMPTGELLKVSMLAFNSAGAGQLTNGQQVIPQP